MVSQTLGRRERKTIRFAETRQPAQSCHWRFAAIPSVPVQR